MTRVLGTAEGVTFSTEFAAHRPSVSPVLAAALYAACTVRVVGYAPVQLAGRVDAVLVI